MEIDKKLKINIVKAVKAGVSVSQLAHTHNIPPYKIQAWVSLYSIKGEKAFDEEIEEPSFQEVFIKKHKYTKEFIFSIMRQLDNGDKISDIARKYNMNKNVIYQWKNKYLANQSKNNIKAELTQDVELPAPLVKEKSSEGKQVPFPVSSNEDNIANDEPGFYLTYHSPSVIDSLKKEVEYLRRENEILRKVSDFVMEKK